MNVMLFRKVPTELRNLDKFQSKSCVLYDANFYVVTSRC